MKDVIKFILFILYTVLIFFISDYRIIGAIFILNLILMLIGKINLKSAMRSIIKLLPFIIFVVLINLILMSKEQAILIGIRLILVCNFTYTFTRNFTPQQLSNSIEKILTPLKIFKINTRDIGIMISIAVAFVPILRDEGNKIKASLESKGFNVNGINMIKNINLILVPLIVSILKRVRHIENAFKSKGYISE